jgi:hypothetical protein
MKNRSSPDRQAQDLVANGWLVSCAFFCSVLAALLALPCALEAQPTAHYPPGLHGINAATMLPPGFYVREFFSVNRAQGQTASLVLTKRFW